MQVEKLSAYLGFIVGDALGLPYEFKTASSFHCIDMIGYGSHNQPKGTWSDDTSMLLAVIDSRNIIEIMDNYLKWYKNGLYTPFDICFDIGDTTRFILDKYQENKQIDKCYVNDYYSNGNGVLHRALPFAFNKLSEKELKSIIGITHRHEIALNTCYKYYKILQNLILKQPILYNIKIDNPSALILNDSGYIVNTLNNAIYCINNTSNYKDAVLMAVNAGGDTDSTAAITGSLAGLKYGYQNIPKNWIKNLQNKDLIFQILRRN